VQIGDGIYAPKDFGGKATFASLADGAERFDYNVNQLEQKKQQAL